jgi:hypothetical protein
VTLIDKSKQPIVVGVGGFTSEVGKTTLLCDLLEAFPGWEAIKTTRGHYRSCGKDPHACCVSHLLRDEPVVRSGRELTYTAGKDTARYWDSGASNVHWVIATDKQVEAGIKLALGRIQAAGVFVEGNSFTKFVRPDYFVMVVRPDDLRIKTTARQALNRVSAFYLPGADEIGGKDLLKTFLTKAKLAITGSPIFTCSQRTHLISSIQGLNCSLVMPEANPPEPSCISSNP